MVIAACLSFGCDPSRAGWVLCAITLGVGVGGCMTVDCKAVKAPDGIDAVEPTKSFRTDGCSLAPDLNFRDCCVEHDRAYWMGGDESRRRTADLALRSCIEARGYETLAYLYYLGVRIGGLSWLPTPWRWGFGWPYPLAYCTGAR